MAKPLPVAPSNNGNAPTMPRPSAPVPVVTPAGAWPSDMQTAPVPEVVEGDFAGPVPNAVPGVSVAGFAGGLNTAMNRAVQQQAKVADTNKRPGDANRGMALLRGIDFTQVADSGRVLPPLHPNGTPIDYEGEIISAEWRQNDKGQDYPALEIKTTFPVQFAGVTIFDNISLGETSQWKSKSLMRATDTLSEDGQTFIAAGIEEWEGHIVGFQINNEEYTNPKTGKTYTNNRVKGAYATAYLTPSLGMSNIEAENHSAPNPKF